VNAGSACSVCAEFALCVEKHCFCIQISRRCLRAKSVHNINTTKHNSTDEREAMMNTVRGDSKSTAKCRALLKQDSCLRIVAILSLALIFLGTLFWGTMAVAYTTCMTTADGKQTCITVAKPTLTPPVKSTDTFHPAPVAPAPAPAPKPKKGSEPAGK
jgi:hypothetical protein